MITINVNKKNLNAPKPKKKITSPNYHRKVKDVADKILCGRDCTDIILVGNTDPAANRPKAKFVQFAEKGDKYLYKYVDDGMTTFHLPKKVDAVIEFYGSVRIYDDNGIVGRIYPEKEDERIRFFKTDKELLSVEGRSHKEIERQKREEKLSAAGIWRA